MLSGVVVCNLRQGQEVRRICEKCGKARLVFLVQIGNEYYLGCLKCQEVYIFYS